MIGEVVQRIVDIRTVGETVAKHVGDQHAVVLRKIGDVALVGLGVTTGPVQQQQHYGSLARLQHPGAYPVDDVEVLLQAGADPVDPGTAGGRDVRTHWVLLGC